MRRIDEIRAEIVANPAQRKLPINLRENSSIDAKWLTSLNVAHPVPASDYGGNVRMCRRLKQDKVHHLMPSKLQRRTLRLKSRTITKIEEGSTADSLKFDPRVAFVTVGGISAAQHHHQGQGDNRPDTQGEWFCDVLVRQEPQHAIVRDKSGRSIRPMAGGAALPVVETTPSRTT